MLSKKNSFKTPNKKKLILNKVLTLGNSNTCKNIFTKKNKNNNNNFINSNFNLYKNNKNRSNINLFSYNNDKLISSKNNELKTINQRTVNFNLKYKDLLYQYQYSNNKLLNKKRNNKYLSMKNKPIIFTYLAPKIKKRISSSVINKEIINAKKNLKQEFLNNINIKSKSSVNFYKNKKSLNNRYKNEKNKKY